MATPDDRSLAGRLIGGVVNPIVESVDIDAVLDDVDIDALLDDVDIDQLLERIDVNALLDRVDINALLDRVDIDRLLVHIDIDQLLERIDINALMDRVDVDALVQRVDVNEIVERTEIGDIIARSTSGVFTQLMDVVRTQIVTVDQVAQRLGSLVVRRDAVGTPPGPGLEPAPPRDPRPTATERAVEVQGRFAGSVSRFLSFLIDQTLVNLSFAGGVALTEAAVRVVVGQQLTFDDTRWLIVGAWIAWAFVYYSASLAATGRTIGKAVLGLIVVRVDGAKLGGRAAMLRTAVFPLSFFLFGIGFLIGLFRRDRRQLHDLIAGSAVLYAWDADTARRRAAALAAVEPTILS